ncbi:ABC transporter ATP-binding protein [Actinoplanes sp. TBRC 11911]|uniref:metal ABC transporter ATP-binding protein n=1 Tax=Actinoplanes sp. TBRC 11911 TaxID=2729386 RepID=UPI00145F73D2|nr:ABC transporter ATP-binding protein [Actinoplanes sp. TBRC 11911]NMO50044.1 ABC transporter ATP-binding protein [Actinoplanes sp. TBRC 11911]
MSAPVLEIHDGSLSFGARTLWSDLDLTVQPGEFLAVLGANGSGKTSLLRVILGQQRLGSGTVKIAGHPARRGSRDVGYVPQQRRIDALTPLRARDLVGQGLDGHRWGIGRPSGARRRRIESLLDQVGASDYANRPVGLLSGGEQQRVRIAQALIGDPRLLLCDEPLLSLDPHSQSTTTALVDQRRRTADTAVVFVTHEINPVLPYVDRVLYLAGGTFRVGSVDEVLNSATLSALYQTPVEVIRSGGRILVAGLPETIGQPGHEPHHVLGAS